MNPASDDSARDRQLEEILRTYLQAVDAGPCSPFDAERKGITLGEGAAYLVLERWDDALARGATILAELCGYGASCDAHHPTAPCEDGRGAEAAMRELLPSYSDPGGVKLLRKGLTHLF